MDIHLPTVFTIAVMASAEMCEYHLFQLSLFWSVLHNSIEHTLRAQWGFGNL